MLREFWTRGPELSVAGLLSSFTRHSRHRALKPLTSHTCTEKRLACDARELSSFQNSKRHSMGQLLHSLHANIDYSERGSHISYFSKSSGSRPKSCCLRESRLKSFAEFNKCIQSLWVFRTIRRIPLHSLPIRVRKFRILCEELDS